MKSGMSAHRVCIWVASLMLIVLGTACSPRPQPLLSPVPAAVEPTKAPAPMALATVVVEKIVEEVPAAVAPTRPPAPPQEQVAAPADTWAGRVSSAGGVRKIIKNGEMNLLVADTDRAIDQVTNIAVDSGGYIISSQTSLRGNVKVATLTLGVPVDQFEVVQRQLRAIALKVLSETASGRDVTDEYVDLQSRLTNLEATAARIREFLKQAQTVEEALKVNAQLTEIEGQINQVKGRMNYLQDRAAFSTLLVNIEPQQPTPTVTPTATPTVTPTPVAWRPDQTFNRATGTLTTVVQTVADLLIWFVVLIVPFLVILAVPAILWLRRRGRPRG